MIEITIYNEKTKVERTIRPFAWFEWPLLLVEKLWKEIAISAKVTTGKPAIRVTCDFAKEYVMKPSGSEVVKWCKLPPISVVTHHVSKETYLRRSQL